VILIGERLNSSRAPVQAAIEAGDADFIRQEAARQKAAGAHYIDINTATMMAREPETLVWAMKIVQEETGLPISIDSPNPLALAEGLRVHVGRPILNSISGETERYPKVLPLVQEYKPMVVALCMDDRGVPESPEDRIRVAYDLARGLTGAGLAEEDIFFDPLIKPIGAGSTFGQEVLDSIRALRREFPRCHITGGVSNVSFGLPQRWLLNQAFLVLTMGAGLDAAIIDPTDQKLMSLLRATAALLGTDEYAVEYLQAHRDGLLVSR
jgi:cobalamin-dependent methionine synthase I